MHEMSLCESILGIIEDEAKRQGFNKVLRVRLAIGALSGAEPDAMRFSFDAVTRGSLAEGAVLEIIDQPGTAWCLACAKTVEIAQRYDPCPDCGGYQLQVTGGDELRIKDLEVE